MVSQPKTLGTPSNSILPSRIRVLVVDDQTLFREALAEALKLEEDLEVVGVAATGKEALELARKLHPDVVLMDLKMPEMDGITATQLLKTELPEVKVLMVTLFGDEEYLQRAIMARADGYILKDVRRDQMVEAIRQVARNGCLIDPVLLRTVVHQYIQLQQRQQEKRLFPDGLTEREVEILRLIAEGMSNKEIAKRLGIAIGTVKMHLYKIYRKIGVSDRTQAALYVVHKGL